ncbi:MAG TPA: twin-arginine translocation signal domain-containing protein, partial [Candidatus Acidoferrales bacterium]|nr:twin-arginine translocation signal domain-containing protein [Candidatus Acidoferrales bacterium]
MNGGRQPFREISRRRFLQKAALVSAALASSPLLGCRSEIRARKSGPAGRIVRLDNNWLFGGRLQAAATKPEFDDSKFARVSLPHCVARLSWHGWQSSDWLDQWIYRRHFSLPDEFSGRRIFLHFDGVMSGATPCVNGHVLPKHIGGYLPFYYEITDQVAK